MITLIAVQGQGKPMCVHMPECGWGTGDNATPGNQPYPRIEVSMRRALDEHMVPCKRCMRNLPTE